MDSRRFKPELSLLRTFECAARHQSFTRAADELSLTQSAVSKHIIALEARLDLKLFSRVRRQVVLTEAGQRFLSDVNEVLRSADEAILRALSASHREKTLAIAAMPTFGSRWLAPKLGKFLASNRNVHIELSARSEPFEFENSHFDLAFHFGDQVWPNSVTTLLCHEVSIPAASPGFLARHPLNSVEEIANVPLLQLSRRAMWWSKWQETYGLSGNYAFHGHSFEQFNMLIEAAISGLGVALLPAYMIERELRYNLLEVALPAPMKTDSSYCVSVPNWKVSDPLILKFISWVAEEIKEGFSGIYSPDQLRVDTA
jgi:LysR family glycine cleavage system transcriptional activator